MLSNITDILKMSSPMAGEIREGGTVRYTNRAGVQFHNLWGQGLSVLVSGYDRPQFSPNQDTHVAT